MIRPLAPSPSRRRVVAGILVAFATLAATPAIAQDYPTKPIRIIVGAPAGGTTDIVARMVAQKLSERMGQSVVVENRGGVGGNIGNDTVAKAAPDGYTLGMAYSGLSINPAVMAMPFDTLKDLAPVSLVATVPMFVIAGPATKAPDLRSMIAEAKAHPGKLAIGVNSLASVSHLAAELFKSRTGVDMTTIVYKGSAQAFPDLIAGRVAMMFDTVPGAFGFVKSGQLRAIAVGGPKRLAILPDVPTLEESGLKDVQIRSWYGVIAPAKTPPAIVEKLSREIATALQSPDFREQFTSKSLEPVGSTPAEFSTFIRDEMRVWDPVAKAANIKVE
jgi:tripartite-type tricarboxylate transporter receptor subunit TctC